MCVCVCVVAWSHLITCSTAVSVSAPSHTLQYREYASEIIAVTQINAQQVYETYSSMSSQMTSSVQLAGGLMNWPNVLFPDFGVMMGNQIIDQTGTSLVTLIPFIEELPLEQQHAILKNNRQVYEDYVTGQNETWIKNSLNYYRTGGQEFVVTPSTPPFIAKWNDVKTQAPIADSYAPIAQVAPFTSEEAAKLLNVDAMGIPSVAPVLQELKMKANNEEEEAHHAFFKPNAKMYESTEDDIEVDNDELSVEEGLLAVPVYDRLLGQSGKKASIVGAIVAVLPWRSLFIADIDVSDGEMDGIYLVVRNSCDEMEDDDEEDLTSLIEDEASTATVEGEDDEQVQQEEEAAVTAKRPTRANPAAAMRARKLASALLTYQVEDGEIVFRGYGDFHDEAYSIHEIEANLTMTMLVPKDESDDVVDANEKCYYKLHLYPSDEFAKNHLSKRPVTFTIAVVVIFAGISTVFMIYDLMVEGRQAKLMSLAVRSGEIVNSLFPAAVRERLMINDKNGPKKSKYGTNDHTERDEQLAGMTAVFQAVGMVPGGKTGLLTDSTPIADLFPKSTVLFGT